MEKTMSRGEKMRAIAEAFKAEVREPSPERRFMGLPAIEFGPPGPRQVAGPVDRSTGRTQPLEVAIGIFDGKFAVETVTPHLTHSFRRAQAQCQALSEPEARFYIVSDDFGIETAVRIVWLATCE